jgi:SEC-C motif-containing protein
MTTLATNQPNLCPCGTNKAYRLCCEPFISGTQLPPTPEALMRSRYTAFAQANMDYIAETMKGPVKDQFNVESSKQWAQHVTWLGLDVIDVTPVTEQDDKGFVEFNVRYRFQNKAENIHERSEFHKEGNRWFYVNGEPGAAATQRRTAEKIGRNDPCPCGSEKKFKKCCGGNFT